MEKLINSAAWFIRAVQRAYIKKWSFIALSAFVFLVNVAMLSHLDLLPSVALPNEIASAASQSTAAVANVSLPEVVELPIKIAIPSIKLLATIANPTTTDIEVLDHELLSGAVRYPTSAELGENGNVVLFGHSSYLPIVNNAAYKTFDGIQKLSVGDIITVYSFDMAYTYQVKSVTKESANDGVIPLSIAGKELTLSTCNSFATEADRFVVVADFVESHSISTS